MDFKYLSLFFLLIFGVIFLLIFAPMLDHIFYVDHKLEEVSKQAILAATLIHIILIAILIFILHHYIIKKYIEYFKLNKTIVKIIDLILALTLTGLQRNLIFKLRYLSSHHPIRDELIT